MLGRLVSSTASRCAATSASRSAVRRSLRRSVTGREPRDKPAKRQLVTDRPEAAEQSNRAARQNCVTPLGLARENVREMQLDERHLGGGECVADREARVRVRAGVDERALRPAAQPENHIDELALAALLRELELDAEFRANLAQPRLDVRECLRAVDRWLACAEEIEARSI